MTRRGLSKTSIFKKKETACPAVRSCPPHRLIHQLGDVAQQTDRGIMLAEALIELLRQQRIIMKITELLTPIIACEDEINCTADIMGASF